MEPLTVDLSELVGMTLAEAVDRLHAKQAEIEITKLVKLWGDQSPPVVYLLPFVARPFWTSFTPQSLRPTIRPADDPLEVTYQIPKDMYDYLFESRHEWFEKAINPLVHALTLSRIGVTGILEPGENNSWDRTPIPLGFFQTDLWELQRERSRLLTVNSSGTQTGVSYIACLLADPSKEVTNSGKVEPARPGSTIKIPDSDKTGFPGRPSLMEWAFEILEERAKRGLLTTSLKTECSEILITLKARHPGESQYPGEKAIANRIRHRYNQLRGPK